MTTPFTAACIQLTAGRDFVPNIDAALDLINQARGLGADLIALPENCTMIEPLKDRALAKAQPEDSHPALPALQKAARETGAWLLIGSLSIKLPSGKIANRSFLIDPTGAIVARYDKIHRFDVDLANGESYRESDTVDAGGEAVLAPTPWGPLGMSVCYDMRFPYLYRALAQAGALYLTVPSAFTVPTGKAHWHVLLRARAIETGCYVIAPAQWGEHAEGRKTYGHSLIVDPWGQILAEASDSVGVITAEIDPAQVAAARKRIPALKHDRKFSGPTVVENAAAAE